MARSFTVTQDGESRTFSVTTGVLTPPGVMRKSVYDPNAIEGDAFDMANMVEAADAKVLTASERTNITTNTSHVANTSNPHSVTAAQVGLGSVDNTSDADKPVSTAQQAALDLKASTTGEDVLFISANDIHMEHSTGHGSTRAVDLVKQISNEHPPFAFFNGDTLDVGAGGSDAATIEHAKRVFSMLQCPRYFSLGNHDNGTGNSITDCTPTDVAEFYDAVEDSHTKNLDYDDDARTLGYYHFVKNGIDYIVLNSVELQAPSEGDYAISDTQKAWLTDTLDSIQGADKRLVVFSHVDPSDTSNIYNRMLEADRDYIQGAFQHWAYSSGGKLLAVMSAHTHNDDLRLQTVKDVTYINCPDGQRTDETGHVKALTYDSGAVLCYYKTSWNETSFLLDVTGNSTVGSVNYTHAIPTAPAAQSFNGTTDYHNTGIIPDSTTELTIVGNFRAAESVFKAHGCTASAGAGGDRFYIATSINGKWLLGYGSAVESTTLADTENHTFNLTSAGLYIDGVLDTVATETISGINYPIHLGNQMNSLGGNAFTDFDLNYAIIKHQGAQYYFYPTLSTP